MLRTLVWRELRWRVLAILPLVVTPAALVAWSYSTPPARLFPTYLAYLDAAWFHLPGASALFLLVAVVVSAGRLTRPSRDLAYLLALPVSRRRWLLTHVALSLAALGALVVLAHLVLAAAARAGAPLPLGPLLARVLAVGVAAGAWVGVTVGVLSLVRHPGLAAVLVLGVVVLLPTTRFRLQLPAVSPAHLLPRWDPWLLADPRAWQGGAPLPSLLAALALGVGGLLLALYRAERFEP